MKKNNKNNTVAKYIAIIGFMMVFLSGCGILVSYIDTNNARKKVNEAETSINALNSKIHHQNQINGKLFAQFSEHKIDLSVAPYPSLQKLHVKMLAIESKSNTITQRYYLKANKFKKVIAGKSQITEKSPDWKHINEFYDNYEADFEQLKDNSLAYHAKLKNFMTKTKENNIFIIQISDLNIKMKTYDKQLQQRSNKIDGMITEMNNNIKGKYTRSLSESQLRKIKILKNQINDFSTYFNYVTKHTSEIISKINLETAGYSYLWTEASMKLRTLFNEIEQDNIKINTRIEKLRTSWNAI